MIHLRRRGSRFHRALDRKRWARVRRLVFLRDGYRCCSCGRAGRLECDHVTPQFQGGDPYELDNLQTLCRTCHIAKTARENERVDPERDAWRVLITEILYHNDIP